MPKPLQPLLLQRAKDFLNENKCDDLILLDHQLKIIHASEMMYEFTNQILDAVSKEKIKNCEWRLFHKASSMCYTDCENYAEYDSESMKYCCWCGGKLSILND